MKKALALILILTCLATLLSCKENLFDDETDTDDLAEQFVIMSQRKDLYVEADDDDLEHFLPDYSGVIRDHTIFFSKDGGNIDEFGIFHTSADNVKALETQLRQHLSDSYVENQAFYDSYIPEETPKLKNAQVRSFGNYVAYAILSNTDKETFFSMLENALKK